MAADAERHHAALRAERQANERVAQELQAKRQRLEGQEADVAQAVSHAKEQSEQLKAKRRE
eukprot:3719040-Prymnesium_polylepis.1